MSTAMSDILLGTVILLAIFILWQVPKIQAARSKDASSKNYFDRENEARKTLAQIVGGVFLIAGLYSSLQTLALQQRSQITDRFSKATEHLGASRGSASQPATNEANVEVRLGGIYSLEQIARDSPGDKWTIMEILAAYVRQNSPVNKSDECARRVPRSDIQAAIEVIARRNLSTPEPGVIGLDSTELCGTGLDAGSFSSADFSYSNLREASFASAHLSDAHLKLAILNGADFTAADLSGADLSDAKFLGDADLTRADLTGANLEGVGFEGTNLEGTDFTDADTKGSDFANADLTKVLAFSMTQKQLDVATGDRYTRLPSWLIRPASWN